MLLLCGNVLFAAGLIVHAFLFNFYLREQQLPAMVMGHQVAAMTLGGLVALVPAGMAIDRWGTRPTLLAGVTAAVAGLVLTALAHDRLAILASAFVIGVGAASCRVSWGPAIMRLTDPDHRARAFAWNVALLIGSGAAWTFAAGWIRDRLPGQLGFSATQIALLAGAAVTALAAACYAGLPSARPSAHASRRALAPPTEGGIRALVPLVAFWMLAPALVLPFFNLYFTDRFSLRVADVGALFAGAHIVTAIALLGAGELARRHGPRAMLFAWMTLMTPTLLLLSLGLPLWAAIAVYVAHGIVAPATNPLIDQLLLERAPPEQQGIVASWRNAAAEGAGAVGASTGGWLLDTTSFAGLLQAAAVVAVLAAAMLFAVLRRTGPRLRADAATI